jgi:sortase A
MRDKRPVDELSIEELERILAIRKREARQQKLRRLSEEGRRAVLSSTSSPAIQNQPPSSTIKSGSATEGAAIPPSPENPGQLAPETDDSLPHFEDDLTASPVHNKERTSSGFWDTVWNRSLLAIEIVAFAGLVVIGVQMFQALRTLQSETAAVQAEAQAQAFANIPTPSPTPLISLNQIVLPGGHTPPNSAGGAQFNYNEIPENLRPIVQQQMAAPITIPTPEPQSPVRIEIPSIGVDAPVVRGTNWEAMKLGVGHQPGTGLPGQPGNMVFSAHNDIYGEIFRYLDQLEPGDEIIVHTLQQRYRYVVRGWDIYSPRAVQVMDPTRDPTATLISCYPYQVDNQRIVVFADLQIN